MMDVHLWDTYLFTKIQKTYVKKYIKYLEILK